MVFYNLSCRIKTSHFAYYNRLHTRTTCHTNLTKIIHFSPQTKEVYHKIKSDSLSSRMNRLEYVFSGQLRPNNEPDVGIFAQKEFYSISDRFYDLSCWHHG
jgi:hypothetical protein